MIIQSMTVSIAMTTGPVCHLLYLSVLLKSPVLDCSLKTSSSQTHTLFGRCVIVNSIPCGRSGSAVSEVVYDFRYQYVIKPMSCVSVNCYLYVWEYPAALANFCACWTVYFVSIQLLLKSNLSLMLHWQHRRIPHLAEHAECNHHMWLSETNLGWCWGWRLYAEICKYCPIGGVTHRHVHGTRKS